MDNYALAILAEGRRRGITPRGIVIAYAVVFVECGFVMYANASDPETLQYPHDKLSRDKNSSGLFQQRPPWWGTAADRMDPTKSAGMFFEALARLDYNSSAHTPGWYAQQVQQSAFPDRYDQRMSDAQALYDRLAGGSTAAAEKANMTQPAYTEIDGMGNARDNRSRPPVNFLLHTEQNNSSAENLAAYCNNTNNGVSYHYTLRDGILVDVVDTDYASWSVLSANAFTINLCFAGSYAEWSRDQWLQRERDIEIAAYIAVQDCRKYGIPTTVIAPPYRQAPGISDHKYVTDCLGIGDHRDVGNNFPWDVFSNYVAKWSGTAAPNGDDDLSWSEIIKNLDGQNVSREDMIKYMDARLIRLERLCLALLDQVGGAGVAAAVSQGQSASFDGFAQGGNRSLYDLAAATAQKTGVPNTRDTKAAK